MSAIGKQMLVGLLLAAAAPGDMAQAQAATREDVLSASIRCGTIQDDHQWLECYYGAAQSMRGQLGLTPAPDSQLRLVPPATGSPALSVASMPQKGRDGLLFDIIGGKILTSKLPAQSYSFDSHGYFTITLADGQVWRQSPGDNRLAKWNRPATDYSVTIREGAIGSIQLEVQGDSNIYKVKRIR